jgi:hypothetical protein
MTQSSLGKPVMARLVMRKMFRTNEKRILTIWAKLAFLHTRGPKTSPDHVIVCRFVGVISDSVDRVQKAGKQSS